MYFGGKGKNNSKYAQQKKRKGGTNNKPIDVSKDLTMEDVIKYKFTIDDVVEHRSAFWINTVNADIGKILEFEYQVDPSKISIITKQIMEFTHHTLRERYNFLTMEFPGFRRSIVDTQRTGIDYTKHADFWVFWYMSTNILMYQSLGDTLGYYNGKWEFNDGNSQATAEYANDMIYEYFEMGGINDMSIVNWRASDDTLMYLETYKILIRNDKNINIYGEKLRQAYIDLLPMMANRHMGNTTGRSLEIQKHIEWNKLQYNKDDKGSGTSMRTGCIGIVYPGEHNREKLIAFAVETSRITHNSAIAILGGITAALFTAYAIEKVPIAHWPHELLKLCKSDEIDFYMEKSRPDEFKFYSRDKDLFIDKWEQYIKMRFSGTTPRLDIRHLKNPVLRYQYFASNYSKGHENFAGGDADDSVIMAYDALLESGSSIEKLILYSVLHPGDSDTVGSIAFSWFGAYYQTARINSLVQDKFMNLEFKDDIYKYSDESENILLKTYYYDIYLNVANNHLKQLDLEKFRKD